MCIFPENWNGKLTIQKKLQSNISSKPTIYIQDQMCRNMFSFKYLFWKYSKNLVCIQSLTDVTWNWEQTTITVVWNLRQVSATNTTLTPLLS